MPILTLKEARSLAKKMTTKYGELKVTVHQVSGAYRDRVDIEVYSPWTPIPFFNRWTKDFSVDDVTLEAALIRLERKLAEQYTERSAIADGFRERFAMDEAAKFLDSEFKKK